MIADVDTTAVAAGLELIRKAHARIERDRYTDRPGDGWTIRGDADSPYTELPFVHGTAGKAVLTYTDDGRRYQVYAYDRSGREYARYDCKGLDVALKNGKRLADGGQRPKEVRATEAARAQEEAERQEAQAREAVARGCGACVDGSCVDCRQEAGDAREAAEVARKAPRARDRVIKRLEEITASAARGQVARKRVEDAVARAEAAAAVERDVLMGRVAYADAVMWALPYGSAERRAAHMALVGAQFDADQGEVARALDECRAQLAALEEAEAGDADADAPGFGSAVRLAQAAHADAMIEYRVFEVVNEAGRMVVPSLGTAGAAWDVVDGHARDMATWSRTASESVSVAEAAANECEAWADAAEEAGEEGPGDAEGLFDLGAPDVRVWGAARSYYGVPEGVDLGNQVADVDQGDQGGQGDQVADVDQGDQLATAMSVAARAAWNAAWGVAWGVESEPREGTLMRVARGDGAPVDIQFAGVGRQCWSHCDDACPAAWGEAHHCTCEPRPVVYIDGPREPYTWED
ncbi:hypothetical protein AB0O47_39905, partial [Streptomyces noursei]